MDVLRSLGVVFARAGFRWFKNEAQRNTTREDRMLWHSREPLYRRRTRLTGLTT